MEISMSFFLIIKIILAFPTFFPPLSSTPYLISHSNIPLSLVINCALIGIEFLNNRLKAFCSYRFRTFSLQLEHRVREKCVICRTTKCPALLRLHKSIIFLSIFSISFRYRLVAFCFIQVGSCSPF